MRRLLPLVLCCWVARLCAQTYVPFPTDTAVWNGIYLWNGSPNPAEQYEIVYRHVLGGDTVLEGTAYKKLHYNAGGVAWDYYGGIREDDQRNIWYRPPGWAILIGDVYPQTPAGTDEVLLYTFNVYCPPVSRSVRPECHTRSFRPSFVPPGTGLNKQ